MQHRWGAQFCKESGQEGIRNQEEQIEAVRTLVVQGTPSYPFLKIGQSRLGRSRTGAIGSLLVLDLARAGGENLDTFRLLST
jgi:hypothetical protein